MAHVLVGFAKAVVERKSPLLGLYCNITSTEWQKLQREFNFIDDNAATVFLLQHNKVFALYIAISLLTLVHSDASKKIMSFIICNN